MPTRDEFSDAPLSDRPTLSPDVQLFVDYLQGVAEGDDTSYAADTLYAILETVKATGRVSDGQRDAVANIIEGAKRRERNVYSRRYDGFRGRRW